MALILGLDGGATKTITRVMDTDSKKILDSISGPTNYKTVGKKITADNISESVLELIEKIRHDLNDKEIYFEGACFGFSGCDLNDDIKAYREIIFDSKLRSYLNPAKTMICNDSKIGLMAGSNNKNGIILICGTGSNCYGINEEGMESYANGWEYILGDEGSGYAVAIKALRAVMKAFDGRGEKTKLTKMILGHLNLKSELGLFKWAYGGDVAKDYISSVARIVCQTAEDLDKKSIKILKEEAEEAVLSVSAVARRLNLKDKNFDLVLVGSLFKCKKYFKNIIIDSLQSKFKKINIKDLIKEPVTGAIKLAMENLNGK